MSQNQLHYTNVYDLDVLARNNQYMYMTQINLSQGHYTANQPNRCHYNVTEIVLALF